MWKIGTGIYIYCVIGALEPLTFPVNAIGGGKVYTVHCNNLAAVVSESPVEKYSVTREHTIAHQKVLEAVLTEHVLLPVRFGTVAKGERQIADSLLKDRFKELKDLLKKMADKTQVGLKVFWPDMDLVFQQIVEENREIGKLKRELAKKPSIKNRDRIIELGSMVEAALQQKKETEMERIMKPLRKLAWDTKESDMYGDQMFVNANFLVEVGRQSEFDAKVNVLSEMYGSGALFKYIGPIPPYNFVEIQFEM